MKKLNFILIFFLIFSSCSSSDEKKPLNELYSQDFLKFQSENVLGIINLDSLKNFSELTTKMGQMVCEEKISGLRFETNDTIYNVTGFSDCPNSGIIGCYFRKNVMSIRNDSLIIGYGKEKREKPISYLKTELSKIMAKKYNFQNNENKVKPALIYFYVEDKYPISTTKKVLKEINEQFSKINSNNTEDYFNYTILFKGFDITNIPPPPPKPIKFDN